MDGIDWATNGHVLVRRDGVQPDDAMSEISWRTDLDASQIRPVVTLPSSVIALSAAGTQSDGEMLVARFERASDQQMVNLDAVYAKVLTGAIVQGSGALDPVYAVDESGAVQAVVMPRTP